MTTTKPTYDELVRENEFLRQQLFDSSLDNSSLIDEFINTAPLLLYIYSIEENRNIYTNDGISKLLGYTPEEMIAFGDELFTTLMHPDDLPLAIKHHQTICTQNDDNIHEIEYRFKHKNGKWLSLHSWDRCFKRDINNKVAQISGVLYDITEQKRVERGLLEANWKFDALFEKGPIGVAYHEMIYDDNGKSIDYRFLDANNAYLELTGVDPRGKLVTEVFLGIENDPFDWIGTFGDVAKTGKSIRFEQYLQPNKRWYDCVSYQYKPNHFVAAFLEITKRKEAELKLKEINERLNTANDELKTAKEKAEESDKLKTAFLQNMSHEIRTPMNAIMGFSGLLVENYGNKERLEKFSGIISKRCNDLLEIISDILEIAKIESGQIALNNEQCKISDLCLDIQTFFEEHQQRIGKEHIKFSIGASDMMYDDTILVDKGKLKQILINLINNAFKFTIQGEIVVKCKIEGDTILVIDVNDSGIGISKDDTSKIFERFTQLNALPVRNMGGTGLGLSIVKGLISLFNGELSLESEVGKGSTFSFQIPVQIIKPKSVSKPDDFVNRVYNFDNKTILIVEDDIYNASYLKEVLRSTNITILHTEFGQDAVDICLSKSIDLVLMDVRLPGLNGYEATRKIREVKPRLPIIAQTAYASSDEKQIALDAGCNDYISKPTQYDLLMGMIKRYIL